ncbi:MAG: TonB-dependent receptor [Marinifilaceae bacterium]
MKLISLFISLIITFSAYANNDKVHTDAHVTGHILNKSNGEHVPYMTVALKGTSIGAITDETGHFFLKNLPLGKHTLVVKGVGFRTEEKVITVEKGKTLEYNFTVEEDNIQLDAVVVSANKNETSRMEAPVVVNVLSQKLFETTNSVCLAQGLSFQPGLRVENNCQNCGFQQVRINGLDGPYTALLMDSKPLFSSLSGVYGIEQIPTEMIERVEVVRGGGSALYGANAIAGTVNIITKEPLRNLFSISHNITAIGGKAFDNTTNVNGSIVSDDYKLGLYVYGSNRERQAYDHDGDGFTEIGLLSNTTFGFRSYFKPSQFSKLSLEYHNIHEFRRGGNNLHLAPYQTEITEQAEHKIHGGGLDYKLFSKDYKQTLNLYTSIQYTDRASYYGSQRDTNAFGATTDLTALAGAQYTLNMDKFLFMPATFTAGTEFSHNQLHDVMVAYGRDLQQDINIYSAYIQNEWSKERFSLLIGGRMDKHSLLDKPILTPRVNIRYNPTRSINLRASYSEGFRAPQAYDEDLHVAAVGGEMALITISDDLKSERSRSYSASVDLYHNFGRVQTNLLVEGFYTHLKDVFILESIGDDEMGNKLFERRNGHGATIKGLNIEGKIVPSSKYQLQLGATIQEGKYSEPLVWGEEDDSEPTKEMLRSPNLYGYMTLNANPFKRFSAAISGTYTGSMYVPHLAGYIEEERLEYTSDFWDMNIKFTYDIPLAKRFTAQLSCGVQNIFNQYQNDFDKGMFRDAGYIYGPGTPRSYFAGIKLNLN